MFNRTLLIVAAIAVLAVGMVAGAIAGGQAVAQTPETPALNPVQTITVIGQGSVRIQPDIARVTVGVETSGETIAQAVAENEAQMEAVLAALKAAGIADKDIQTTNFSISLDRYPEPLPSATGEQAAPVYRVSNMVTVTIRALDRVGQVLDAVIEAGANNIWGVSFTIEDPAAAQADARTDAMTAAAARAEALATLAGVELGSVMSVSEVISSPGIVTEMAYARDAAGGTSISPGEVEIGYQVQVSYFIVP
ncbi:MAG: SIMPL domain-containing protein [Anaerolineae bacterium]|nr:SIMPL domain-containing protein [Anaerolineae bacterium]